jgi:Amt family ammonium transporter
MPTGDTDCLAVATSIPGTIFACFQMMFALMVPVIVTGAFAEKLTMKGFFVFVTVWPFLVYYPIAHWVWGGGWLSALGAIDFAGGITIHSVAGWAGMIVSLMLQKRRNIEKLEMTHHNIPMLVTGGTIVWAGWYSFNGCSALVGGVQAANTLLNTHLSASLSGLCWVFLTYREDSCFHVTDIMNGAFAGLAGITPGSGFVNSQGAFVIGICVGCASWWTCRKLKSPKYYVDDTLDCFSLQAVPGMVGSILVGFFKADRDEYGGTDVNETGLFYGGNGQLLLAQCIGVLAAVILSCVSTYVTMKLIQKTVGTDISWADEDAGLDVSQIGEIGYDYISRADNLKMDEWMHVCRLATCHSEP